MRVERRFNPLSRAVHAVDRATTVTTIMVFTIQHTQSRQQAATQLKLDELIRALPGADDHLVHVESGGDAELAELEARHIEHHLSIRADE